MGLITVSDVTFEWSDPPTDEQVKMLYDLLPEPSTYVDLDTYTRPSSSVGLERSPDKTEVAGSIPASATKFKQWIRRVIAGWRNWQTR